MRGKTGIGSSTERHQGHVAAAIYANCAELDNRQLEEVVEWVGRYKPFKYLPPAPSAYSAQCLT